MSSRYDPSLPDPSVGGTGEALPAPPSEDPHRWRREPTLDEYRDLVESFQEVVFSIDRTGFIEFISGAVRDWGFGPDEVIGRPFLDFIHVNDRPATLRFFHAIQGGGVEPHEFRIVDRSGRVRPARSLNRPIRVNGLFTRLQGVVIDLTAQRAMEDQIRAVQRMDAIGRLAGGVAHDFNNVLSVILSYSSFLVDDLPVEDPRRSDAVEIREAARRGAALTRQLLAFSRKQVLRPEPVDLNQIVGNLERLLRRVVGEDVDLQFHLLDRPCRIQVDPGQMEQVLLSLVMHARESMPDGGSLIVETQQVVLGGLDGFLHDGARPGTYIVLVVSDTGTGMDQNALKHVFDPYSFGLPLRSPAGLGLAVAYGFVKQSGGAMTAYSEIGRGSTFKAFLRSTEEQLEPRIPAPSPGDRRHTILVLEDEPLVLASLARILEHGGYRVIGAQTPTEAIELYAAHAADIRLVLTDVVLPEMNGREFIRRLESLGYHPPVLYVSGYAEGVVIRQGVLTPSDPFLTKPVRVSTLLARAAEIIGEPAHGETTEPVGGTP